MSKTFIRLFLGRFRNDLVSFEAAYSDTDTYQKQNSDRDEDRQREEKVLSFWFMVYLNKVDELGSHQVLCLFLQIFFLVEHFISLVEPDIQLQLIQLLSNPHNLRLQRQITFPLQLQLHLRQRASKSLNPSLSNLHPLLKLPLHFLLLHLNFLEFPRYFLQFLSQPTLLRHRFCFDCVIGFNCLLHFPECF